MQPQNIFSKFNQVVLLLVLFAQSVSATPLYLGAGLGMGINYFSPQRTDVSVRNPAHASAGFNLFLGYQINHFYSLELGYLTLGYYENSGQGTSICDQQGNCGYPEPSINPPRFRTNLNVVNQINTDYYVFDNVFKYKLSDSFTLFAKLGIAYDNVNLQSYVTVLPNVDGIGIQFHEDITAKPKTNWSPHIALGYSYRMNTHFLLRSQVDYFFPTPLYSTKDQLFIENQVKNRPTGIKQGTLEPILLNFGIDYRF